MNGADTLLDVVELSTVFQTPGGDIRAVDGISFSVARGETLGIVGESGSGKSQTLFSLMGLFAVQRPRHGFRPLRGGGVAGYEGRGAQQAAR